VDARSLLEKSEILEFETAEEIFFFVLNLLWYNKLAAELQDHSPKKLVPATKWEIKTIGSVIESMNIEELNAYMTDKQGISRSNSESTWETEDELVFRLFVNQDDFKKIKLKQS
jgi:hypothetical protein